MKVQRPSKNPITGQYTMTHKGYDFAGLNLPDEIRAGLDGTVVETSNLYNTSWRNTGALTTRDYGNYIKVKHDNGSIELHAHIKQNSMLSIGTRVRAGQVIARIGHTGNSSGPHLHSEYRTAQNINIPVDFTEAPNDPLQECLSQRTTLVAKLTAYEKKEKDWIATEQRLKDEKDQAIREGEVKLRDEIAKMRPRLLNEFRNHVIAKLQEIK